MYVRKTTRVSDDIILIQEHGPGRYGAPGEKRAKRQRPSPEAVKKQNRRNRAEKIQLAMPKGIRYDREKVQVSPMDPMLEVATEITELDEQIANMWLRLSGRKAKALDMVAALEDSGERQALTLYYLTLTVERRGGYTIQRLMTWEDVAAKMGYSIDHIYTIHRKALKKIEKKEKGWA